MDSMSSTGDRITVDDSPRDHQLAQSDVFMWNDRPHVAVSRGSTEIIVLDTHSPGGRAGLSMPVIFPEQPTGSDWQITDRILRAFRIVPLESSLEIVQVTTITEVSKNGRKTRKSDHAYILEATLGPDFVFQTLRQRGVLLVEDSDVSKYTVSQSPTYFQEGVDHPDSLRQPRCGPIPISIYGETPHGIVHHTVWPKCYKTSKHPEESPNRDDLFCCRSAPEQRFHKELPKHFKPMVLPGAERAIVLLADARLDNRHALPPSVVNVFRYVSPLSPCGKTKWSESLKKSLPFSSKRKAKDGQLPLAPKLTRKKLPRKLMDTLDGIPYEVQDLMYDRGVVHADWDEAGGKLALVLGGREHTEVVVLNLAAFEEIDTGVPPLDDDEDSGSDSD
ncbi:hypothetical protein BDV98DRAFT_593167 [Pterulicium gracile]|uniref:Uncharacterized protein n=1 Tax=Pterulicium gracile TaxID=1884261 RepID=A0A5C3QIC5_9AGAR|nr:hypothetical protein BDV98DRAFT_593167 [Pterula gracilis]